MQRCRDILLIEDDPADVFMYRKALEPHMSGSIHCEPRASGVAAALRAVNPAFVVTDLNLPGADGTSVIQTVRRGDGHRALPVIVCSTSADPADVERAYAAGANAYVRKPGDLDGWSELARCLACFWGEMNLRPV
jgi:two-component system response regulator